MKAKASAFLVLALIIVAFIFSQNIFEAEFSSEEADSVFVFDGDTFQAKINGKIETVRLLGVDSPEIDSQYSSEECFGEEAADFLKKLLVGEELKLLRDSSAPNRDEFNRLLRYVYRTSDNLFINAEILKEGFANTFFLGQDLKFKEEFLALEREAFQKERGLWLICEGDLFVLQNL